MNLYALKMSVLLVLMSVSNLSAAHIGHDHSHASSMLVHLVFYGAVFSVCAVAVAVIYKTVFSNRQK